MIEGVAVEAEPQAQPVAALVVKGQPGLVHPDARRLADDQEPRLGPAAHDRARAERQLGSANPAGADLIDQPREIFIRCAM